MSSEQEDIDFDREYVNRYGLYGLLEVCWHILCPKEKFVPGLHVRAVCDHTIAAVAGFMPRLLMNVPPGSSKSLIVSVLLPAFVWGPMREPHRKFMYAAYATQVATKDANRCRDLIRSDWFQARWPLELDGVAQSTFYTTRAGGWRFSEGINAGTFTSRHPDYLIVDDPVSAQETRGKAAELKTALRSVQEVWDEVLSSRALDQNNKVQIVIMQRLHDEDLVGYLLERSKQVGGVHYEHMCLPMLYDPERKYETKLKDGRTFREDWRTVEDEPLCPERWGPDALAALKFEQGNAWSAQYQQSPSNKTGEIFKRAWFRFWDAAALHALGADPLTGRGFDQLACSWDFTFKDTVGSDFVCGQVWGKFGPNYYMLERVYQKMNFPTSLTAIEAMIRRWPTLGAKVIEDKANGPAIIASLMHKVSGLIAVNPQGGKIARANAVSFLHRAGNIWYPPDFERATGNESHVECMARFPAAKHDDSVDAETQMLSYFEENQNQVFAALAARRRGLGAVC